MKAEILERLSKLTEEERYDARSPSRANQSLYTKSGRFIIERRRMSSLSIGESTAPICLRPHPRFREFPPHTHDYVEIMYICSGQIVHQIQEKEICLTANDLVLLGKYTSHAIRAAGSEDIGINLIISSDLFEALIQALRPNCQRSLDPFDGLLRREGNPYLVFHGKDSLSVQNLMESMIYTALCEKTADGFTLQQSLRLLLCYLASMVETHAEEERNDRDTVRRKITEYVRTSYSTATLTEAAEMLGLSAPYLSRICSRIFAQNFKELVMEERFHAACALLTNSAMPVGEIILRVGYENSSYFHKEFKKRYGTTPKEYRKSKSSHV